MIGRVARSRDIRAPNVSELYSNQTVSYVGVVDPLYSSEGSRSVLVYGGGNASLRPEKADTWTAGITTAPMRGLTASIDYFNISIKDVITSISAQVLRYHCRIITKEFFTIYQNFLHLFSLRRNLPVLVNLEPG